MATACKEPKPKGPAAAARRKRRIALRKQAVATGEGIDGSELKRARIEGEDLVDPVTNDLKPSITGIKKQHRYQPGVPMTKDQLKNWRKEARRVRNRESAAASRKRNRVRIDELETEGDALKAKYAAALKYIMELEGASSDKGLFTPETLRQDLSNMVSPSRTSISPVPQPVKAGCTPLFPRVPFSLNMKENYIGNSAMNQHLMISNIACAR